MGERDPRVREGDGTQQLRALVDAIANQLCRAVDGDFGFSVRVGAHDETVEKLAMVVNIVLDSARRALESAHTKTREAQRLEVATLAAEGANRAKNEFLANMSHELRTPLTAIQGYADLLAEGGLDAAEQRDAIDTVRRSGAYLLHLIDDVLDVSRIEQGELRLVVEPCALAELFEDVARLMRPRARAKQLDFALDVAPDLPALLRTDRTRLSQILINLVGNAIKFTDRGAVRVSARCAGADAGAEQLQVDIRDSGVGIAPEHEDALFRFFQQADASAARRFGGSGLGLAISRALARRLGGDVQLVASAPGVGSHFRATVQLDASPAHPSVARAPAPAPALCGRVLLAEDGPDNRRLIAHLLTRAGLVVDAVENGQQVVSRALAALDAGEPYAAILMDLQMPHVDGYAAIGLLREAGYTAPIVALTAHAMESERARCMQLGADGFETKPIELARLLGTLARLMEKAEGEGELP